MNNKAKGLKPSGLSPFAMQTYVAIDGKKIQILFIIVWMLLSLGYRVTEVWK
jgi:hypothetical protein